MTITQLKIVLLTAERGSISAAARELNIPQPNASSGIKSIEKELGFEIFKRNRGGITITEKGKLFLVHAQRIVEESNRILSINDIDRVYQLRVGCTNYFRGRETFIKLCASHKDEKLADLQYYNVSIEKGISLLNEHKLDIVIGLTVDALLPTINKMADLKRLTCVEIEDAYPALTLRREHPLITEHAFENGFDANRLGDYPYIAYHSLNADFESPYYRAVFEFPRKYSIYVEEKETRFKLVRDTDAFMLGAYQPQEVLDQYSLTEIPYPGYVLKMIVLYRDIDEKRKEILEYIDLLMQKGDYSH